MAWSMNKVVFVGGVYVLDPSCASPTCRLGVSIMVWVGTSLPTHGVVLQWASTIKTDKIDICAYNIDINCNSCFCITFNLNNNRISTFSATNSKL